MTVARLREILFGAIFSSAVVVTILFFYSIIFFASPRSAFFLTIIGGATWLWGMSPFAALSLLVHIYQRPSVRLQALPVICTVCGVCLFELHFMVVFVRFGSYFPGAMLFLPLLSLFCIPVLYGFIYLFVRTCKLFQRRA